VLSGFWTADGKIFFADSGYRGALYEVPTARPVHPLF